MFQFIRTTSSLNLKENWSAPPLVRVILLNGKTRTDRLATFDIYLIDKILFEDFTQTRQLFNPNKTIVEID